MAIQGEVGIKEWNAVECFELSLVSHGGSFLSKAKNQKTRRNELKKDLDYIWIKYAFPFLFDSNSLLFLRIDGARRFEVHRK